MIQRFRRWWHQAPASARGITAMIASTIAFSSMHAAITYVSQDLHPFQVAFFRNAFGFLIFLPVVARSGLGLLSTQRPGLHAFRALLNVAAMLAFFTALAMTPIAKVTALGFTAPLFMSLLSVLFMKEPFVMARWVALAAGIGGMLLVLQPGLTTVDTGSVLVIVSAFVWAVTMMVIKTLSRTDSSMTITAYMVIWLSVFSFIPAVLVWKTPPAHIWVFLVFIGCSGTLAQLLLAESLKQADATVVMPYDFLKLVWATALGYALFNQVPEPLVWVGGTIIFAAGTWVLVYENRRKRKIDLSP